MNIERQKISERDILTYDEKERIAKKSDHKCAHCGRKVYYGYGATVDHFVPLYKGGTNRDINLIMLCEKCNKEKSDFIVCPDGYLPHLKDEHFNKLSDYFVSYTRSFEYVNRGNLLACDIYTIGVEPVYKMRRHPKDIKKLNIHYLKRAVPTDRERITEYFIKYLKKYDLLMSEEAAGANIEFWMKFGCIYYIEKDGEIKILMTAMVTERTEPMASFSYRLTLNVFSYYSNNYAYTLAKGITDMVPGFVMQEQDLEILPVKIGMVKTDKLSAYTLGTGSVEEGYFRCVYALYRNNPDADGKKTEEFFKKFKDVKAEAWLKAHEDADWMIEELCEDWSPSAS